MSLYKKPVYRACYGNPYAFVLWYNPNIKFCCQLTAFYRFAPMSS